MFSVYCKQCGSVLLLGPANIVAVQNISDGIVVHFQCHSGHRGVWLAGARMTGASSDQALLSTGGEHAPHLVTASAAQGPSTALARHPSVARRSADARPWRHLPDLDTIANEVGARSPMRASQAKASSSRSRWTRAPWRRGRQSCGDSVQR
jgi:hypothetical protein